MKAYDSKPRRLYVARFFAFLWLIFYIFSGSSTLMEHLVLIAQAQNQLALVVLAQAGVKEYEADWLTKAKTVTRDTSGRFASKADSIKKVVEETIKDPQEAKRKVSSELIKLTAKGLDKLVSKYPEFAETLLDKMFGVDAQKARDRLADIYSEINPGLPNAIKPDPLNELLTDVKGLQKGRDPKEITKDLKRVFEQAGYNYNKLIDDLNNVESESEAVKLLGKIAATSIPITAYLAATLTPEIFIGMLAGDTIASILASAAATQAVSFAANKAMDKANVENPWFRLGVDLAIGMGVGATVSYGINKNPIINTEKRLTTRLGKTGASARVRIPRIPEITKKENQKLYSIVLEEGIDKLDDVSFHQAQALDNISDSPYFINGIELKSGSIAKQEKRNTVAYAISQIAYNAKVLKETKNIEVMLGKRNLILSVLSDELDEAGRGAPMLSVLSLPIKKDRNEAWVQSVIIKVISFSDSIDRKVSSSKLEELRNILLTLI